ncbi:MAG TPA: class I SAM-dependent methyltransferase [Pyrinomonadaceae bacterium]|nr:class I SAM-dependent methyltransferase [Pyrinomonadaceae bacterium]
MMKDSNFNQAKAEAFSETLVETLNKSAIALALSIGDRCGLFKVMANLPASTSKQIADAANLNERYVREWLGTMVTGRVVNYFPETQTYQLPAEHAAYLTDEGEYNFASAMQFVPVLAGVEDRLVECFEKGGGVPYTAYPRFQEVMAKESDQTTVAALESHIIPIVPGLDAKLKAGIDVLDVGCGAGRAMITLAKRYPNSRFAGYDFSDEGIAAANAEAAKLGLDNVRFEVRDAANIGETEAYDLITSFDAIHDQANPSGMLASIAKAIRPDGVYLVQDITGSSYLEKNLDLPVAPWLYTISLTHCMTVSLAYNGEGLGAMWGEERAVAMMKDAGFQNVEINHLEHDFMNTYYVATK